MLCTLSIGGCDEKNIDFIKPTPDKEKPTQKPEEDKGEDNKEDEPNNGEWDPDNKPEGEQLNGTTIDPKNTHYGLVTDATSGAGIAGVVVSDGFTCVQTDSNGVYQLARHEKCEVINISIPAEYEIPVGSDNLPAHYHLFTASATAKMRHDFTLKPLAGGKETRFTMLALGDIQCHDMRDTERFNDETMVDIVNLVPTLENAYAISLGDVTNKNNSAIWAKEKQIMSRRNVTFFNCMGNHDHLNELTPNDHSNTTSYWKSVENFHKYFGPQNYSFDRGDVHFVVMDNALHGERPNDGGDYEYATGIYDWGYKWFLQDMSFVPKSKAVVFICHIPFRDGSGNNHPNSRYRQNILNKLSEYREAHIWVGHSHRTQKYIHTVNGKRIVEHVHAAVHGNMWHSSFGLDGSPNGYGVWVFGGPSVVDNYYKSVGYDRDYQMRVYNGSQRFYDPRLNVSQKARKNYHSSYSWNKIGYIYACIWDIEHNEWEVSLWQNGQKVCNMTKMNNAYDWYINYWWGEVWGSEDYAKNNKARHLYEAKLADPTAPFEVRAVDKRGIRGPFICNHYTTDYEGIIGDFDVWYPENQ